MKKIVIIVIIVKICFHSICFCQWNFLHHFPYSYNDAIFTSSDTGYYCSTVVYSPPDWHSVYWVYLLKTTDNCNSWKTIYYDQSDRIPHLSIALKYHKPFVFFITYYGGNLGIQRFNSTKADLLPTDYKWICCDYLDLFVSDYRNYKLLFSDWDTNLVIQSFIENDNEIRQDTFYTYKPTRIFYPVDTVGILLSLPSLASTGSNTLVIKYTQSTGYNIVYQDQSQKLSNIHFPSAKVGYVAGNNGVVLRSYDLGSNWTALNTGFSVSLNSIFFVNDSTGYAVGSSSTILKTTDYGQIWKKQTHQINSSFFDKVFFVNDSVGFILSGSTVGKTTNGGEVWINEKATKNTNLEIFPNPNNGIFALKAPDFFGDKIDISIFTVSGKEVQNIIIQNNENLINVNASELPVGVYFLRMTFEQKSYNSKFIITK